MQFYRKGEWVNYDLIPRKHVDPVRRLILRHRRTPTGTSWDEYPDLLFIGSPDDPGLLVKAAIWVIYKRNDVADWAQFAEVFGAPIREYTYPTDDDEARQRALDDADSTGKPVGFRARGGYGAQARGSREQDRERGPLRQALRALQQRNTQSYSSETRSPPKPPTRAHKALGTVHKDVEEK